MRSGGSRGGQGSMAPNENNYLLFFSYTNEFFLVKNRVKLGAWSPPSPRKEV